MADRNLLVPGTQATTLRDQNDTTVYNAVRVSLGLQRNDLGGRPRDEWQALLSVEHEPGKLEPSLTSLLPGTEIRPGSVAMTPYDRLPKPLATFPYAWRLDIRFNARRLLEYLRANKPANGRWNLIGHSQGGIVIVLAGRYTTHLEEFARLVARVVLVGCPIAGTLRALEVLASGRGDFGEDPFLYDAARGMAQTWPALYQMLPGWDSVVDPAGNPLPESKQVTRIGGYPGVWKGGMSEDLLERARETHKLMERPLAGFGPGVAALVVQGQKQDTPTWLTRDGPRLATTGNARGSRFELDFGTTAGDTLVPSDKTVKWAGRRYDELTLRIAGPVKAHAFLCDGKFVTRRIAEFLKDPAPAPPETFGG